MSEVTLKPPVVQSRAYLQTAGRALMSWWNAQGPSLPREGEVYRAWWRSTYDGLERDLWAPGDVWEQLQYYSQEARQWWDQSGRTGKPPPVYAQADMFKGARKGLGLGVIIVLGLLGLALATRSAKR